MEGQLTGPHDQSGCRDWLEAASALTTTKHPDNNNNNNKLSQCLNDRDRAGRVKCQTCSSPAGSRCFRPSSKATGVSAAHTDSGCSGGRRRATPGPQPIGRSGRTPAHRSRRISLAPGWTRLSEPGTDRDTDFISVTSSWLYPSFVRSQ